MWWKRSHIVYIDTRWLFLKVAVVVLLVVALVAYWKWTRVTLIEFESKDLASSWQVTDLVMIKQISKSLDQAAPAEGRRPGAGIITMRLTSRRESREYIFTEPEIIFDSKKDRLLKIPETLAGILRLAVSELRKRSPFGEMLDWEEVKEFFPVGAQARVKDLDSGRKFSVRRTGGYSHADVEPLTKNDAAAVRMIYDGRWSWKRRAVVIEVGGRKIAASLTGMPHGKGELKENDCYGKIGLYFAGRGIERSSSLAHLVMIWKAAGKTREKLRGLSPEETLLVLFTALDQRDPKTLELLVTPGGKIDRAIIQDVIGVTVTNMRSQAGFAYQVTVSLSMRDGPYNQLRRVPVHLTRDRELGMYRADSGFLSALLRPGK